MLQTGHTLFSRRVRLAPYKRIRRLQFAELPKTLSGKVRRVELRRREDELRTAGARGELEYWEQDFPALQDTEDRQASRVASLSSITGRLGRSGAEFGPF